jgi:hypothetical protein
MVIVQQTTHRAYILAEMDGAVSKLRFAAFRVDNLNTTQTPECTKEKYNTKIKMKGSLLRSHQQPM